jgi:hypothetical protein
MQMINIEVILQYLAANWPIMFLRAEFKLFILLRKMSTVKAMKFFVVVMMNETLPPHWAIYTAFGIAGALYMTLVGYLCLHLIEAFGGRCCARLPVSAVTLVTQYSSSFYLYVIVALFVLAGLGDCRDCICLSFPVCPVRALLLYVL